MRERGFLPSDSRYALSVIRKKRCLELQHRWSRLSSSVGRETQSELRKLHSQEILFDREGHPDGWGQTSVRLALARSVLKDLENVTQQARVVVKKLEEHNNVQRQATGGKNQCQEQRVRAKEPPLFYLPDELLMVILEHLIDPKDVSAAGCSCTRLAAVALDGSLWKRLFARFTRTQDNPQALEALVVHTPLAMLFGHTNPTIWRELYHRLYYVSHTDVCPLCRTRSNRGMILPNHTKSKYRGSWSYQTLMHIPYSFDPAELSRTSFGECWHQVVVESACVHCKNVMLMPESQVRAAGLAVGVSLPRLFLRKYDDKLVYRVFLEDAMAYTHCTRSPDEEEQSPMGLLPRVRMAVDRDSPNDLPAWEVTPSFFKSPRVTSQRRTRWEPPTTLRNSSKSLKRKRKKDKKTTHPPSSTRSPAKRPRAES